MCEHRAVSINHDGRTFHLACLSCTQAIDYTFLLCPDGQTRFAVSTKLEPIQAIPWASVLNMTRLMTEHLGNG